jgi:lipoprotein-anchoring transpeptidase ErfK/SrfK
MMTRPIALSPAIFRAVLVALLALAVVAVMPLVASAQEVESTAAATTSLNVRSEPSTDGDIVRRLAQHDRVTIVEAVSGEEVVPGNSTWFRLSDGSYVYSEYTTGRAGLTSSVTDQTGRWIEVDRGARVVQAVEDGRVIYSAPATIGREAMPTPTGSFTIIYRVANETMSSDSLGIPSDSPDGWHYEDVLYTQYFTEDGVALHYNWWSPRSEIGGEARSAGCIGLLLDDAEYFWDFGSYGMTVVVTD